MTPEERIRELARRSAIDATAAERLLAAIQPAPVRTRTWDPFERLSPVTSTLLGVLAVAGMVALSRLHVRSPGLIDLRATDALPALPGVLLDQVVAFPIPVLVLWGVGLAFARRTRLLDMAAAVGLARVAVTVLSLPLGMIARMHGAEVATKPLSLLIAFVAIVIVTAEITLLVLGFRNATALRGVRLTVSVVLALFVAELTSHVVRALLPG